MSPNAGGADSDIIERLWSAGLALGRVPTPGLETIGASPKQLLALSGLGSILGSVTPVPAGLPRDMRGWLAPSEGLSRLSLTELGRDFSKLIEADGDGLASLYYRFVDSGRRRTLGTFFTPPDVVDAMLDVATALCPNPTRVVDAGAGVGAFSIASARRWPAASVTAVDINVVTLGLNAIRAARAEVELTYHLGDFLAFPDPDSEEAVVWVGNPPFTRYSKLEAPLRRAPAASWARLVQSGQPSLAAMFWARIIDSLNDRSAFALLLPASMAKAKYADTLRALVEAQTRRDTRIVLVEPGRELFPGAKTSAFILAMGPVAAVKHAKWVATYKRSALDWTRVNRLFDGAPPLSPQPAEAGNSAGSRLGDIGRVRRGIATGANAFFIVPESLGARLPNEATHRLVRRLRGEPGTDEDRPVEGLLLTLNADIVKRSKKAAALVRRGVGCEVHMRALCASRDPWYELESASPATLLISPMTSHRFRVVTNEAGALHLNNLYGVYLTEEYPAQELAAWLRSDAGQWELRRNARTYGEGFFKLEPSDLRNVIVPGDVAHRTGARGEAA